MPYRSSSLGFSMKRKKRKQKIKRYYNQDAKIFLQKVREQRAQEGIRRKELEEFPEELDDQFRFVTAGI